MMQSDQHILAYEMVGKESSKRMASKHRVPASKAKILARQNED